MSEITCLDLEIHIMSRFDIRQNIIVPNVTDQSGLVRFETDMVVLNQSGYATGFEIKISKSDLNADFKKIQHAGINIFRNGISGKERYYGKFKYFYYAVPKFLEEYALTVIPDFCGLYSLETRTYPGPNLFCRVRKPQLLFKNKWTEKQRYELARLGAMRLLSLKSTINCHLKNKK